MKDDLILIRKVSLVGRCEPTFSPISFKRIKVKRGEDQFLPSVHTIRRTIPL